MAGTIKVFVTSCETGPGAWRAHEINLLKFYELSDKRHELVADPELAEIILIGNVREENWGEKILANELINRWPNRCFSLSDQDHPLILNRGIYASGRKSLLGAGRVRSGSYTAYPLQFQNPYGLAHRPSDQDYARKQLLFSFIGRNSDKMRNLIFKMHFERPDILVEDSSQFDLWDEREDHDKSARQKYFIDTLLRSKFSLCPRGAGASSLRLFESLRLGVAPVIASDQWIFPEGPRWRELSVIIKDRHLREIESIVSEHEADFERMGRLARQAHEEYFSDAVYFNYVVDNCLQIKSRQMIPESFYWRLNPGVMFARRRYREFKANLKSHDWLPRLAHLRFTK
jgi:hypothetical protein